MLTRITHSKIVNLFRFRRTNVNADEQIKSMRYIGFSIVIRFIFDTIFVLLQLTIIRWISFQRR